MENVTKEMMQKIKDLLMELDRHPNNYNLIVQAGNAYFNIQRYNKAVKYYAKANNLNSDENVLIDLDVCYFNLGKLDSALVSMESALEHNPGHMQGLYNIGIVHYNMGLVEDALENWKHLVYIHHNSREAHQVQQYINEINNNTQIG